MTNVILVVHLILALALIGVVLMQRSEGGGLGIGGGGGAVTGRAAGTALGKVTWALAIAFLTTSITLTVMATRDTGTGSLLERLGGETSAPPTADDGPALPPALDILPPRAGDAPAGPPRAD
ncbi:MAG: preprotein translocase subunit SecG [Rhodobacteraceae bacterium]|nr:preprotein translocase subunit SecG [Paracoccaceae bacterium]